MRLLLSILLIAGLMACSDAPAAEEQVPPAPTRKFQLGNDAASAAAAFRGATERMEKESSKSEPAEPTVKPLAAPLPGDIVPTFEYSVVADLTNRTANTTRQVPLQTRGLGPEEALTRLQQAFVAKGWEASEPVKAGGDNLTRSFWRGGTGRGMTTVVVSGGTYVTIVTSRYDPARNSAFSGTLNIIINAP